MQQRKSYLDISASQANLRNSLNPLQQSGANNRRNINASTSIFQVFKQHYPRILKQFTRSLKQFIADGSDTHISNPHISIFHSQLVEIAQTCYESIQKQSICLDFLYDVMDRIDKIIESIKESNVRYLHKIWPTITQISSIISTPCRTLELMEGTPDLQEQIDFLSKYAPNQTQNLFKYLTGKVPSVSDFLDNDVSKNSKNELTANNNTTNNNKLANVLPQLGGEEETDVSLSDFNYIKDIAAGKYGKSRLVQYKDTDLVFLLKTIPASRYLVKNKVDRLFAERDIMFYLKSIFIANLFCTFVTNDSVCFLMEYISGGDMAKFLDMGLTFSEDKISDIIAQLVLAIEYLHSKDIVHRDLKPQK